MHLSSSQRTREQEAWQQVGQTAATPRAARGLVFVFLATLYAVPLHQHLAEWRESRVQKEVYRPSSLELARSMPRIAAPLREYGFGWRAILNAHSALMRQLDEQEHLLEDKSLLGRTVRPRMQQFMSRWLGVGTEEVYIGRDGWLFYRPGLDYLTGPGFLDARQLARRAATGSEWVAPPQPDPGKAILDFKRQLEERGITLVLVPTPVKAGIHPERFTRRLENRTPALHNPSHAGFIRAMEEEGVIVYDPSSGLHDRKMRTSQPQFLAADTHWRPEAMESAAARLADLLRDLLPPAQGETALRLRVTEQKGAGDLAQMLDLPAEQVLYPPARVELRQVLTADGQFWRPSEEADVLVLGDSFSNIYSLEGMGWGEAAGFVEHLAFHLGRPVDRLIRNDGGAFATREMLSRELARGRDRLAGKHVVVWQFAARELAIGDWRLLPMELRAPTPSRFLVPAPGQTVSVRGTVRKVSPAPRPGTVPYRDHVVSIHLVDLPDDKEALVYMMSMIDNQWTRAARLRYGEEIVVRLQSWEDVADRYEGLNRSELEDPELLLQEPCWGEWE